MRIVYCPAGKCYQQYLLSGLRAEGHLVTHLGQGWDALDIAMRGSKDGGAEVVIAHIEDVPSIGRCMEIMKLEAGGISSLPKLVVLSSLLTWAGGSRGQRIQGVLFSNRVPTIGCANMYSLENALFDMYQTGHDINVIGIGLVYGNSGFDFEDIFRALYAEDSAFQVPSLRDGRNKVPMVHCADLLRIVDLTARSVPGSVHDEFPPVMQPQSSQAPFFVAATDQSERTLQQVLVKIGAGSLRFMSAEAALENVLSHPSAALWDMDLTIDVIEGEPEGLLFRDGLSTRFKDIWGEFLVEQNLLPVSFVITGPPYSGKTEVARALANSLKLQFVDVMSTVRYILSDVAPKDIADMPNRDKLSRMGSSTLNLSDIKDPHVALKKELLHILDAKALEIAAGAKGKPNEGVPGGGSDYLGEALTEELCACLPGLLIRECIFLRVNTDPTCIKRGYVLDLWKRVFSNLTEYLEMTLGHQKVDTDSKSDALKSPFDDNADAIVAAASEEEICQTRDGKDESSILAVTKHENYLAEGTALVVELQMDKAALLPRYAASVGIDIANPKLSKDQQAALKMAEGVLENYFLATQPVPATSVEKFDEVTKQRKIEAVNRSLPPEDGCRSDPGILEMESVGAVVLRLAVDPSINAENVATVIRQHYEYIFPSMPKSDIIVCSNSEVQQSVVDNTHRKAEEDTYELDDAPQGRSDFTVVNDQLENLSVEMIAQIRKRNDDLQNYLLSNVMLHLSEMLVTIERDRPEDPMKFAYTFLAERAISAEEIAREAALKYFEQSVAESRALEEQAAAVLQAAVKAAEMLSL